MPFSLKEWLIDDYDAVMRQNKVFKVNISKKRMYSKITSEKKMSLINIL